jgi:ubiquinone/menaquinone biosynthesis C-methylase UbiE
MNIRHDDFSKLEYEGWQRVADQYNDRWAHLTRQFVEPLLNAAVVSKGQKVLDVACGTGIVSEKIRAREGHATGLDFAPEMVKLARHFYPDIEFFQGDAQQLPFHNESFDRVVMNFGMLHLPEPLQAMKEAYRVLRKKGKYAFTVWAGTAKSPAAKVMNDAQETFANMNVSLPAAPPYDYFEDKEKCIAFLSEAGFNGQTMQYETRLATWLVPDAGYLFDAELNAGVRNAAFLRQQSPETLQKIKLAVEKGVEQFKTDDGYELPFLACIIAVEK